MNGKGTGKRICRHNVAKAHRHKERDKGIKEQRERRIEENGFSALCLCASVPLSLIAPLVS
jgi:hypothetical protein